MTTGFWDQVGADREDNEKEVIKTRELWKLKQA